VLSAILYTVPRAKIIEVVAVEFVQVRRESHEQHWQAVELRWMTQRNRRSRTVGPASDSLNRLLAEEAREYSKVAHAVGEVLGVGLPATHGRPDALRSVGPAARCRLAQARLASPLRLGVDP
jgi:hypothetical protein